MADQFLYTVEYHDWNGDFSSFIDRSVLAVGENEQDAIQNAKQSAQPDSRDFKAKKIDDVMGVEISVSAASKEVAVADPLVPAFGEKPRASIQAYIENANDDSIGGFTIPLPTTKEALQPWLAAIGAGDYDESDIIIKDARSSAPGLTEALHNFLADGATFDELNYLAAKIGGMKEYQMNSFTAAIASGRYSGSIKDAINLADNIDLFDLQPAFSEAQYGEFQIEMEKDNTAEVFERLEKSDDLEERELAQYILRLEAYVDEKAYGRGVAKEEDGVFSGLRTRWAKPTGWHPAPIFFSD